VTKFWPTQVKDENNLGEWGNHGIKIICRLQKNICNIGAERYVGRLQKGLVEWL
jgi:hypothetical protein